MKSRIILVINVAIIYFTLLSMQGCEKHHNTEYRLVDNNYKTKNVVVVLIDGPRFSETWGHPNKAYVPFLSQKLAPKGIVNQEFYNFENTQTISGHTACVTGLYQLMYNNGDQYPRYPSFLQYWLAATNETPEKAWIISAKEKLEILGNCSNLDWRNKFLPMVDARDRSDLETFDKLKEIMTDKEPNLVFINFSGPDRAGHGGKWEEYLDNISIADSLLNEIVMLVDSIPFYKDKTTVIMTNDHGRHLDGIADGFIGHGDFCHGCTHLNFFAYGPDFHSNLIINNQLREQVDIVPTIGSLLGIEMEQTKGNIMTELFK